MANDLNRCEFIGRLGADPELRYFSDGTPVANLRIAVGKQWKDRQTGEKKEHTTWVPVVIKGKLADAVGKYLGKGSRIYVAGEFFTRKWQDQSGQDRYTTEVVVGIEGKLQMLDSRPEGQPQQPAAAQTPPPAQQVGGGTMQQPAGQPQGFSDFDDDIPFDVYQRGSVI